MQETKAQSVCAVPLVYFIAGWQHRTYRRHSGNRGADVQTETGRQVRAIVGDAAANAGTKMDRDRGGRCITLCHDGGAGSAALTQAGSIMIFIDKMTVGAAPAGFEFARTGQGGQAQWVVSADATALNGHAIEQTSTDTTDYRFPLAI